MYEAVWLVQPKTSVPLVKVVFTCERRNATLAATLIVQNAPPTPNVQLALKHTFWPKINVPSVLTLIAKSVQHKAPALNANLALNWKITCVLLVQTQIVWLAARTTGSVIHVFKDIITQTAAKNVKTKTAQNVKALANVLSAWKGTKWEAMENVEGA